MNLRNQQHKIKKKEEQIVDNQEQQSLQKQIKYKVGKNKPLIYYNNRLFELRAKENTNFNNRCQGCFFNKPMTSNKRNCPLDHDRHFNCDSIILKKVKIK